MKHFVLALSNAFRRITHTYLPAAIAVIGLSVSGLGVAQAQTPTLSILMYFSGSTPAGGLVATQTTNLFGPAFGGNGGLIYHVTTDAGAVNTVYQYGRLGEFAGNSPQAALLAIDGDFYGTTYYRSANGVTNAAVGTGTIFKLSYNPSTGDTTYTKLFEFADETGKNIAFNPINSTGAHPQAQLIAGPDNYLYGTTTQGGTNGTGTIFKIKKDGSGFQNLHHFGALTAATSPQTGPNRNIHDKVINTGGAYPRARLLLASNNYLYATTSEGGANGTGVIFRVATDGTSPTEVMAFDVIEDIDATVKNNINGAYPSSGLVQPIANGFIYGTTERLGVGRYGNVYRIAADASSPTTTAFETFHAFNSANGTAPSGELLVTSDGSIVGTTLSGGTKISAADGLGTIYKLTLSAVPPLTTLFVFTTEGATPAFGVIETSPNEYYGITTTGGPYGAPAVFKLGTPTNTQPQGIPQPYDYDGGGSMALGLILSLAILLFYRRRQSKARFL